MLPVTDTAFAPGAGDAAEAESTRSRGRRWVAAAAALAVVAVAVTIVARPRAATLEEFATSAQKLDSLSAPAGSFTPYDPTWDGAYGSALEDSWSQTGTGTWSSTADPNWWVAVRGWKAPVAAGQEPATCRAVLGWFATTGRELGLATSDQYETLSTCLSALDTVRSTPGAASDAWAGRGTQSADGQLHYRIGVETVTGPVPGQVILRVEADATVANR